MSKITLVGAGSVVFAKNLICDILQYPALSDSTICLMDIDQERLKTIEILAKRVVAQLGVNARIEATQDLRAACQGAKFVITTFQIGGYKPSTVVDFEIPAKYGLKQTIADTLGVGGIFRALRTIPELVKVAHTMQEIGAPNPQLINYSNPMAMNMWGIERLSGIPAVGLCHSVQGTSHQISSYCGIDVKDVSYLVAGINHMAFFLKFEYKGKDAYPLLFKALEQPNIVACDRVRFEMMRRLGYFVTESSEHQSEYNPYFIHHGESEIKKFDIPINEYIRRCVAQIAQWGEMEKGLLDESQPVEIHRSVEYGSSIIDSMVSGQPRVIYGNVPNAGLIENLPAGCSVEVPCLVDKQGIQPTHIGNLPPQLASIIRTNVNVQELTVEAAATGRRDYIYQAVMADPNAASTLTLDQIWSMCDELIEAHQRDGYLGEFKPVARNTGKPLAAVSRVFLNIEPEGVPFLGGAAKASFNLVAVNETNHAFKGEVRIEAKGATLSPAGALTLDIAAGKTVSIPFSAVRDAAAEEDVVLSIASESAETIERDLVLPKRKEVRVPASSAADKGIEVAVKWSGNEVAKGRAWLTGAELALEVEVNDTGVKIAPAQFWWDGSAIEIGLKNAATNAPANVIMVLPDEQSPKFVSNRQYIDCGNASVRKTGAGYTATIKLPLAAAGLKPGDPFLFELIFHVSALGTAHGKIRASWQGSGDIVNDQSRFLLVNPGE